MFPEFICGIYYQRTFLLSYLSKNIVELSNYIAECAWVYEEAALVLLGVVLDRVGCINVS